MWLLRRREQTDSGSEELGQYLGELTQLQEAGVRVFRKIPLRQHTQAQELFVMLLQLGEVGAECCLHVFWSAPMLLPCWAWFWIPHAAHC